MAQIDVKPDSIGWSLPFSDDSKSLKIEVSIGPKNGDIVIKQFDSRVLVSPEDISWLIDVLLDARTIVKMFKRQ